jgi:NAD+ kinase
VAADTPAHLRQRGKNTECFVHALLESQRRSGAWIKSGLKDIAETLAGDTDAVESADTKVEPKSSNDQETVPDEQGERKAFSELPQPLAERHGDATFDNSEKFEGLAGEGPSPVHSRLLTKKQLSDMALGVRELSKRLGSIRLKLKVKSVFLLTKAHDETLISLTREVASWLLSPERDVRYTVYVEHNLRENKKFHAEGLLEDLEKSYSSLANVNGEERKVNRRLRYWTDEMCRARPHTFDFVVTLGGDGTVLYASWLFQRIVPPVLSFSLGSLGFLTKFDYEDFRETLTRSFRDGVTISLRLRFEGTVMRSQQLQKAKSLGTEHENEEQDRIEIRDLVEELVGEEMGDVRTHRPDGTYEILNDIVVDRGPNASKNSFCDDSIFCILTFQQCLQRSFLVTMSTLLLFRQMVFALRPLLARQPTALLLEALCVIPKTLSSLSQPSVLIRSRFAQLSFLTQ